ncbi:MAG: hypothetical protein IPP15_07185 [Saprospiraceae bacterium]|uniref:Uncharacterized protein n=1 Tax=Candidatus Opimibacter skivensis TaxID=2982028 RepID=A0A9D7XSY5_9BACT|nr:hypothetical protein [Candidatus Opimibacter skivensis]
MGGLFLMDCPQTSSCTYNLVNALGAHTYPIAPQGLLNNNRSATRAGGWHRFQRQEIYFLSGSLILSDHTDQLGYSAV